ncbi:MAG: S-layer homology domain-containing protein [Eubacteriales bacterium]|nr:S-layer homology domain-containing protein [Eubacteriales bacterium]
MKKKVLFLIALLTACLGLGGAAMATQVLPPASGEGPSITISSHVYRMDTVTSSGSSVTVYVVPDGTEMTLPDGYFYIGAQLSKTGTYQSSSGILEKSPHMNTGSWRSNIYRVTPIRYTDETKQDYESYDSFYFMQCDRSIDDTPFVDIKDKSKYYFVPVVWAYETGRTSGTDATHFSPSRTCSRAEMITFLWNAAGRPEPASYEVPFTDISPSNYYYKAVAWAYENHVTSGTDATHFSPKENCTRAQAVSLLYRAYSELELYAPGTNLSSMNKVQWQNKSCPFGDVTADKWYYDAVRWAYYNEITSGVSSKTFDPSGSCTRGQMITFFFNIVDR